MTLGIKKSTIIKSMMVAIIVICMFQQQIYDGTSKENEIIISKPTEKLGLPTPPIYETSGGFDFNYTSIGNWSDAGSVYKVIVIEDVAFVADGVNGFRTLDISNRSSPVEIGSGYDLGSAICYDLVIVDTLVFLAYGVEGIVVVDVQSLSAPNPLPVASKNDFLIETNETVAIDIDDKYAYLACQKQGLVIVSIVEIIDDEDTPEIGYISTWSNGKIVRDVEKKTDIYEDLQGTQRVETYAFVTCANDGLRIIDVSAATILSPTVVGNYSLSNPYGLSVRFNFTANERVAFVADSTGLYNIPLFTPANIPRMETDGYNNEFVDSKTYYNIWLEGKDKLFAISPTEGMKIFNITYETATVPEYDGTIGRYYSSSQGKAVTVDERYAYISDGSNGLDIVILDNDSDLLYNGDEVHIYGTDPNLEDTDDDEIDDGDELFIYGTDPLIADTDEDLIEDGEEIIAGTDGFVTDPLNNDTDTDNLSDGEEVYGIFYPTNTYANGTGYIVTNAPLDNDADNDGLFDGAEVKIYLTDPLNPDSEGDGMDDEWEVFYGLLPNDDDSLGDKDSDGLNNISEYNRNTNPSNDDSDGDGLTDGEEVNGVYVPSNQYSNSTGWIVTNAPNDPDSDNDGLFDGAEAITHLTNPFDEDSDSDSLDDFDEVITHSTDPNSNDTDSDTMLDAWEIQYGTNPFVDDTTFDNDSDLLTNLEEYSLGTDPLDDDTDGDLMKDGWEVDQGLDPLDPVDADLDEDDDELTNYEEFVWGTNPYSNDTDSDGMDDKWEVDNGTNPIVDDANEDSETAEEGGPDGLTNFEEYQLGTDPHDADSDNDGLIDGDEYYIYGTDPTKYDTDGDRYSDKEEIEAGSDPLNSKSTPVTVQRRIYIIIGVTISLFLIASLIVFFIVFRLSRPDQQMFRYLKQEKDKGELSLSVKQISEHLDKKLNKGQVKQLINEFSESKNLTLDGNRVWLTNNEELEDFLEEDQITLEAYKEQYPGKKAIQEFKDDLKSHSKAANKLKLSNLEAEFSKLLTETDNLKEPVRPEPKEDTVITEEEDSGSHGFGLPDIDQENEQAIEDDE